MRRSREMHEKRGGLQQLETKLGPAGNQTQQRGAAAVASWPHSAAATEVCSSSDVATAWTVQRRNDHLPSSVEEGCSSWELNSAEGGCSSGLVAPFSSSSKTERFPPVFNRAWSVLQLLRRGMHAGLTHCSASEALE
ncbi:hypothetical protein V6N13_043777 [Hibiscus sabdariffa]